MAEVTPPPPTDVVADTKILAALDNAWRRFNAYDNQSNAMKRRYRRLRLFIIIGSFLTTFIAVVDAVNRNDSFSEVLRFVLVILPLVNVAVLDFAARFESGNAWVGFRVAAETIKRSIYELRLQRALRDITLGDLKRLNKVVQDAGKQLDEMGVTTPVFVDSIEIKAVDELAKPNPYSLDDPERDDGYGPIKLNEYLEMRVLPQAEWYRRRAVQDYQYTRWYRVVILGVGVIGSVLAAFGEGQWVAVTVAGTSALVAYLGLQQYEQNYGLYDKTGQRIEDLVNELEIISDTLKKEDQLQQINRIEDVFSGEREMWQLTVLRGQASTEQALTQLVNSRTNILQRFDDSQPTETPEPENPPPTQPQG